MSLKQFRGEEAEFLRFAVPYQFGIKNSSRRQRRELAPGLTVAGGEDATMLGTDLPMNRFRQA